MRKLILLALFLSGAGNAALIDRGEGFIYDDVLDITWTQNANINGIDTWDNHVAWAEGYSQTHSVYGTFDDWRLASMDVNGDGTLIPCYVNTSEPACRDNELGYLHEIYGVNPFNEGLFTNVQYFYFSGSVVSPDSILRYGIDMEFSDQYAVSKNSSNYAWAVRDGDVVPLPAPLLLLASALAVLGWRSKR